MVNKNPEGIFGKFIIYNKDAAVWIVIWILWFKAS